MTLPGGVQLLLIPLGGLCEVPVHHLDVQVDVEQAVVQLYQLGLQVHDVRAGVCPLVLLRSGFNISGLLLRRDGEGGVVRCLDALLLLFEDVLGGQQGLNEALQLPFLLQLPMPQPGQLLLLDEAMDFVGLHSHRLQLVVEQPGICALGSTLHFVPERLKLVT
ncbi:hypothetical protein DUNSADRAFT_13153 [Dunaliella salina]|uniref:Secreted protein n=1 Tax=Dunaliella salina TaxID=3046 RepID=A0ABQ7G9Y7_DUNSA|nr:hypothetical protein DUNSADRAFT_13153 [Dunaliella salina]|eukprot:KAF5831418.1 hypothetical protein DUNSADRAFT_13153 [Dunaliella salina]